MGFPAYVLEAEDRRPLAALGRDGWYRIFFGRGRRVRLPDGTEWSVVATERAGEVVPLVASSEGKLAIAASNGRRSYSINGRDYAYRLFPSRASGMRRGTWLLQEHETTLAQLDTRVINTEHRVPIAATLLAFTVIKYGILGEADLTMPEVRWV